MVILTKKLLSRIFHIGRIRRPPEKSPDIPEKSAPQGTPDGYRGVVFIILIGALLGSVGVFTGGAVFMNGVLLDAGLSVLISAGILLGVALTQAKRAKAPTSATMWVSMMTGFTGIAGCLVLVRADTLGDSFGFHATQPHLLTAGIVLLLSGVAAALAATVAHYLSGVNSSEFPESVGLAQGARVLAWIFGFAGISAIFAWLGQDTVVEGLHFTVLAINTVVSLSLLAPMWSDKFERTPGVFPLDYAVFSLLGKKSQSLWQRDRHGRAEAWDRSALQLGAHRGQEEC